MCVCVLAGWGGGVTEGRSLAIWKKHTHTYSQTQSTEALTGQYQCCCGQQVAVCWPACLDPDNSRSITPWKLRSDHWADIAAHSLSVGRPAFLPASQPASLCHGAKEDHNQGQEGSGPPILLEKMIKHTPDGKERVSFHMISPSTVWICGDERLFCLLMYQIMEMFPLFSYINLHLWIPKHSCFNTAGTKEAAWRHQQYYDRQKIIT